MSWSLFYHRILQFADEQALGWCLLLVLAAVCGGVLLLLFRLVRRESSLNAAVWTLATAALSVVLAGVRIALARRQALAVLLGQSAAADPSTAGRLFAEGLSRTALTPLFVSPVLALAILALLAVVLWGRPRPPQGWLAALAASLLLLTALAVYVGNQGLFEWRRSCARSENPSACYFEMASDFLPPFRLATRCLVVTAVLGWSFACFAAVRDARQRIVVSGRGSLISTVLLLAGLVAFWLTRAEHADAAHLAPPDRDGVFPSWIGPRLQAQLPLEEPGCLALDAAIFQLEPAGFSIDGNPAHTPEELRAVLLGKRQLWQERNPYRKFPAVVLLAAPRSARAADLLPWLLAAHEAGYTQIGALLKVPTIPLQTRTVGVLDRGRCCIKVWSLGPEIELALNRSQTWGDVVAAAIGSSPVEALAERWRMRESL